MPTTKRGGVDSKRALQNLYKRHDNNSTVDKHIICGYVSRRHKGFIRGDHQRVGTSLFFQTTTASVDFTTDDFEKISWSELSDVLLCLPSAAPGSDGITSAILKMLCKESKEYLLDVIMYFIRRAWIPLEWKIAKFMLLLKNPGYGYVPRY